MNSVEAEVFLIGRGDMESIQARAQCERDRCLAYMYMPRYEQITLHQMATYLVVISININI